MDIEQLRDYILSLPGAEESDPFADDAGGIAVYTIGGKWFAVHLFERPDVVAVKCDPDRAIVLRDRYNAITPAWHFNKRHWNDLNFVLLPPDIVKREIRHSYLTVIRTNVTPKALRTELLAAAESAGVADAEPLE